jgi:hypothetical protein
MFEAFRRPAYAAVAVSISTLLSITFLYFNEFLFFSPGFVFYLPQGGTGILALDLALSILSGIVIALSLFQIRNTSMGSTRSKRQGKTGLIGIFAALFAGACPCYYLVPLLAISGGAGGALAAVGIIFEVYQIPIKLFSLALLASVTYSLERSLRASCDFVS